ncbi:tail fiber assembly protein [Dickeya dianthicola]|uniref:tail fiber assembly protein n=1 Tax=Dickeya dianthicola TaxID=204039 RepID=UPI0013706D3B|nr:tail fiber assembly protein [Dickeya dianthicola]MCI4239351.1 tail fiber assembly protein [Dickeya dianthicola]MCI4256263.1 tail fiber assembly protein [Dickeya dianthicola]MZG23619.1 tail fiber assembly protein [Dickeya dianthicola]MZI91327.1 tail fiber assembly protein [Dickeya dianthicola]
MRNNSVMANETTLDENGHAVSSGWITVYHVDASTREYLGNSQEYLLVGTGIPADSYADTPELPGTGQALCRTTDGQQWEYVPDYRGATAYHTETREPFTVASLGELPAFATLLAPSSEFDVWSGKEWVTDKDVQKQAEIIAAQRDQGLRLETATTRIQMLGDAVELNMATDDEVATLNAWKAYRVLLNRVDVNAAPDIDWPEAPAV